MKAITVIYRGSTAPEKGNMIDSSNPDDQDVRADWLLNDIPTAIQVLNNGGATVMPQLKSSSITLQEIMNTYPNAMVDVYGHSLGSMRTICGF